MKRNKIAVIFAITSLLAGFHTACTDLEPEIYSDILVDEYYKTPEQFSSLLADAYTQLAGEYGYVYREGYWSMQEYTSDEVVVPTRGTDWFDNGVPIAMHTHTWEENTRDVNNGWSFAYGGVGKCNNILDMIVKLRGKDENLYDEATIKGIAETKTLRAFYHLLAMDLYGNVAISASTTEPVKQSSRKEVFAWIEKEILDNINRLDKTVRYGSVTKPVAHAILAKLYLNAEVYSGTPRWQDAANQCDSIINGNYAYSLNEDYYTTFKKANTNNREIIFPIVFDAVKAEGNMFHLMTLHYAQQDVYEFTTGTWNGPCTPESFYNKYSPDDKRIAQWFTGPIEKDGKVVTYKRERPVLDANGNAIKTADGKKDSTVTVTEPAIIVPQVTTINDPTADNTFEGARFVKFEIEPGIGHHANSDFPIYRYADILLMKAEALMRINGGTATQIAVDLANEVRKRTGLTYYTTATLTLPELLDERGRELAWEGHRRQDQIRFGTYTSGKWEFMPTGESPNRTVFPIPQWVLDANPGVYTQNTWK
ncbi:MAG: RagB/SusD family nutrient uptake outer membrane protein [Dysgonamonadaceae bacterium]|jgi:hypothetical protein|nr:RagB/SusD family nutrient uptake outer membrane protein [Dysgonamonadaceae bacterium]